MLVFSFIILVPGDPAAVLLGDSATPEEIKALTKELGLDRPIYVQYLIWVGNVLQGDFGTSLFSGDPVLSVIADGAETSILLALMTMCWILLIGIPAGVMSATRHGSLTDQTVSGAAMLATSIPTF